MQNNGNRLRGDGSTVRVWGDPAACGTGRVDYIHPHLGGVSDIKEGDMRKSEIGSGSVPDQAQRKSNTENNRDMDPQIRVMDKFGDFCNPACQEGHLCPMDPYGMDICIRFQPKGECVRNCSRSHHPLRLHIREDYICFINRCRAGY